MRILQTELKTGPDNPLSLPLRRLTHPTAHWPSTNGSSRRPNHSKVFPEIQPVAAEAAPAHMFNSVSGAVQSSIIHQ